jgi:hypothetical protein
MATTYIVTTSSMIDVDHNNPGRQRRRVQMCRINTQFILSLLYCTASLSLSL